MPSIRWRRATWNWGSSRKLRIPGSAGQHHGGVRSQSRLAHKVVKFGPSIIYLAVCVAVFYLTAGEGRLGWSSGLSLLLTLPWSVLTLVFAWVLIHDGARVLLWFLVPFSWLNAYLIHLLARKVSRKWLPEAELDTFEMPPDPPKFGK